MRASAAAISSFSGRRSASTGRSSACSASGSSTAASRARKRPLAPGATRSPSRRQSDFASTMYRARVRTSVSRTTSSARTCRWASLVRCAGRYAPVWHASASVRASRRSVFTRRERLAYIGAKFGSATITV